MSNVFGFSTEPSAGGDFTPIIKYDARAGRIFRIDRIQTQDGFASEPIDITTSFKAVMDFENIEVGWIDFPMNSAPSFVMVPMGQALPGRPSDKHKNGVRILLKLAAPCGGEKRVREIGSVAKAFLGGIEQAYVEFQKDKSKYPGQLPVLSLVSTTPVTSGSGALKSTNYRPTFRIDGWARRPDDLIHIPASVGRSQPHTNGSGGATNGSGAAPATGAQTVPPPNEMKPQNLDDDFG